MPNTRQNHIRNLRKLVRAAQGTFRFPFPPEKVPEPIPPGPDPEHLQKYTTIEFTTYNKYFEGAGDPPIQAPEGYMNVQEILCDQFGNNSLTLQPPDGMQVFYLQELPMKEFYLPPWEYVCYISGNAMQDPGLKPYNWKIVSFFRTDPLTESPYIQIPQGAHWWRFTLPQNASVDKVFHDFLSFTSMGPDDQFPPPHDWPYNARTIDLTNQWELDKFNAIYFDSRQFQLKNVQIIHKVE